MSVESLLIEWEANCRRYGIDLGGYPTPDYWADVVNELEYARASITEDTSDKEIADNVRACLWLRDIGSRWETI